MKHVKFRDLKPGGRRRNSGPWSETELEILFDGFKKKCTAREISGKLSGRSKNSVIGKLHRLQLTHSRPIRVPARKSSKKKLVLTPKVERPAIKGKRLNGLHVTSKMIPSNPVKLLDLKSGQCKNPVIRAADDGQWLFCGLARFSDHSPYCKFHHQENHRPSLRRK